MNAKGLRKKLKNGLIVDKWDLVSIIERQEKEIEALKSENEKLFTTMLDMALDEEVRKAKEK